MWASQIFMGLHLQQAAQCALKLKLQLTLRVELLKRHFSREHQFDIAIVKLVHHINKTSSLIIFLATHLRNLSNQHRMKLPGNFNVIILTSGAITDSLKIKPDDILSHKAGIEIAPFNLYQLFFVHLSHRRHQAVERLLKRFFSPASPSRRSTR